MRCCLNMALQVKYKQGWWHAAQPRLTLVGRSINSSESYLPSWLRNLKESLPYLEKNEVGKPAI